MVHGGGDETSCLATAPQREVSDVNTVRKVILLLGTLALVATILYPPWQFVHPSRTVYLGYAPLWSPPAREGSIIAGNSLVMTNLVVQAAGIAVVTTVLCLVTHQR
jgi:hypothetical protein